MKLSHTDSQEDRHADTQRQLMRAVGLGGAADGGGSALAEHLWLSMRNLDQTSPYNKQQKGTDQRFAAMHSKRKRKRFIENRRCSHLSPPAST